MPILILWRHAKAVRDHEADSDKARALTPRGQRDAAAAAAALVQLGLTPQLALVSTAARTRETWAAAAPAFARQPTAQFEEGLYLAAAETLWRAGRAAFAAAETVALVAHNPGLHELAGALLRAAGDHSKPGRALAGHLPTAAFAAFEVDADSLALPAARLLASWRPDSPED